MIKETKNFEPKEKSICSRPSGLKCISFHLKILYKPMSTFSNSLYFPFSLEQNFLQ